MPTRRLLGMDDERPHESIWLWAAGAWILLGLGIAGGYSARATRFDSVVPLMIIAYTCGSLAIMCVAGAIRGWRFPFTKGGGMGSDPPKRSPGPTGHAGPRGIPPSPGAALPPRPTIRREPLTDPVSQSEARIERFNEVLLRKRQDETHPDPEHDGSAGLADPPPDPPRPPMSPPPSFEEEERSYRRIIRDYDETPEAIDAVNEWIDHVRSKLEEWNPRGADAFDAGSIFEGFAGAGAALTGQAHHYADEHLRKLSIYHMRLHRIIDDD